MKEIKKGDNLVFIKDYIPFKKGDLVEVYHNTDKNILVVKQPNDYERNVKDTGFNEAVVKIDTQSLPLKKGCV